MDGLGDASELFISQRTAHDLRYNTRSQFLVSNAASSMHRSDNLPPWTCLGNVNACSTITMLDAHARHSMLDKPPHTSLLYQSFLTSKASIPPVHHP